MFEIVELYQYSSSVRRKFLKALEKLPWELISKPRNASFNSMKDILLHMIENEDMIVNWQIQNKGLLYKRTREWGFYTNMQMIREYLNEIEEKTKSFLKNTENEDFGRQVNFALRSRSFSLSVEECLFQSFTEQLYHLGELIALLWQEGIEPPHMQWFQNNPRDPT